MVLGNTIAIIALVGSIILLAPSMGSNFPSPWVSSSVYAAALVTAISSFSYIIYVMP